MFNRSVFETAKCRMEEQHILALTCRCPIYLNENDFEQ